MAVKLRLARHGNRHNPIYKVVAADSRSPRDGRFIEIIGQYNPQTDPSTIKIDKKRAINWLARGAKPTNTVDKLLKIVGLKEDFRKNKKKYIEEVRNA